MNQSLRRLALAAIVMIACAATASSQDFYEARLEEGKRALAARDAVGAAESFRIAAFGFLNRPELLVESLTRLALAQSTLGQTDAARQTVDRFVVIESRFGVWPRVSLEAETRASFESLLRQTLTEAQILAIPSLEGLVETEEEKLAALPARERRRRLEQLARSEPSDPRWPFALASIAAEQNDRRDALRWASQTLEIDPAHMDARALRVRILLDQRDCDAALAEIESLPGSFMEEPAVRAGRFLCLVEVKDWSGAAAVEATLGDDLAERADIRRARARLAQQVEAEERSRQRTEAAAAPRQQPAATPARQPERTVEQAPAEPEPSTESPARRLARATTTLRESQAHVQAGRYAQAERLLYEALRDDRSNRELRLALLEAATLARDWKTAVAQVPLLDPIQDSEPRYLFYAGVALFESGSEREARAYMTRAQGRITASPYVEEYYRRVLGSGR